jgi:hypothetical protein
MSGCQSSPWARALLALRNAMEPLDQAALSRVQGSQGWGLRCMRCMEPWDEEMYHLSVSAF